MILRTISIVSPFFGRAMLVWIVDAGNFACCLAYCMVSLSFLVLRNKKPKMNRPYEVGAYRIVGITAVVMAGAMTILYVLPGTNCSLVWQEWIIVGGWCLLGFLLASLSKKKYGKRFAEHILDEESSL